MLQVQLLCETKQKNAQPNGFQFEKKHNKWQECPYLSKELKSHKLHSPCSKSILP